MVFLAISCQSPSPVEGLHQPRKVFSNQYKKIDKNVGLGLVFKTIKAYLGVKCRVGHRMESCDLVLFTMLSWRAVNGTLMS